MSNLIIFQFRINQIMSSEVSGWIHIKFDEFSIDKQIIHFINICYHGLAGRTDQAWQHWRKHCDLGGAPTPPLQVANAFVRASWPGRQPGRKHRRLGRSSDPSKSQMLSSGRTRQARQPWLKHLRLGRSSDPSKSQMLSSERAGGLTFYIKWIISYCVSTISPTNNAKTFDIQWFV